jgi:RNA polymerase sigma factor (sigma-70 family)
MADANDIDLLRDYARHNSEAAFAELVRRHVNLVYSVALRFTGQTGDAEDVTQAVFIILAQKAAAVDQRAVLTGWLYETTRFTSSRFLRTQARRRAREQEACMQSDVDAPDTDNLWRQLAPHLEAAMSRLGERDRALLALRFYENKTGPETAALLGMTEEAVRKRVGRALERLYRYFSRQGISSTTGFIASAIATNSIQVAPAVLAKSITAAALDKGAGVSTSTLALIKGAMKIMAWTKAKTAIVIGAGFLLVAGTGAVFVEAKVSRSEPSYQGRRLTEWLADVDYGQPQDKRQKAGNAIRQMGARTLPFLLADLDDARFKTYARPHDRRTTDDRYRQATWAYDALGPLGKSSIPELARLLEQDPGYVPSALGGIGRDALPVLLNALTNQNFFVHDNAAAALANAIFAGKISPDEASDAFPIALSNLTYTDSNVMYQVNTRDRAAWLLAALKQSPELAVPALTAGLKDPSGTVSADCAFALWNFGKEAKPAIPALTEAAASTNAQLSNMAKQALDIIRKAR